MSDIFITNQHPAPGHRPDACQDFRKLRLAIAGDACQPHDLAGPYRKGHLFQCGQPLLSSVVTPLQDQCRDGLLLIAELTGYPEGGATHHQACQFVWFVSRVDTSPATLPARSTVT